MARRRRSAASKSRSGATALLGRPWSRRHGADLPNGGRSNGLAQRIELVIGPSLLTLTLCPRRHRRRRGTDRHRVVWIGNHLRRSIAAATKASPARVTLQFFTGSTTGTVFQDSVLKSAKQTVANGKEVCRPSCSSGLRAIRETVRALPRSLALPVRSRRVSPTPRSRPTDRGVVPIRHGERQAALSTSSRHPFGHPGF